MNKNLITGLIACSLLAGTASAATLRYRASGDWSLITNGTTPGWGPNAGGAGAALPGASDDARINFGNNTVTVTTVVPNVSRVQIGVDESGIVEVDNGGVLSSNNDFLVGNNNANATGTLNVNAGGIVNVGNILYLANNLADGVLNVNSGGQVTAGNHLWWGVTGTAIVGITGTLTQTSGILGLGTNNASTASGGTATVTIGDGGLFALNNISGGAGLPSIQAGSLIDITGTGELTLPGDLVGLLGNYVAAGKIVGDGGGSSLTIDLTKNAGFTTVYIVPEPSMFGLLGMASLGCLLRRRRSR